MSRRHEKRKPLEQLSPVQALALAKEMFPKMEASELALASNDIIKILKSEDVDMAAKLRGKLWLRKNSFSIGPLLQYPESKNKLR